MAFLLLGYMRSMVNNYVTFNKENKVRNSCNTTQNVDLPH